MARRTIRLLHADEDEGFRARVEAALAKEPGLDLVASVGSGAQALRLAQELRPQVALVDRDLTTISGVSTCRRLVRQQPSIAVIMLVSAYTDDAVYACMRAGARGVLTKSITGPALAYSIRSAASGQAILAYEILQRMVKWQRELPSFNGNRRSLSPREIDLLAMVGAGLSNRQIGERVHLSEHTVKVQLRKAMGKLGARKRTDAVAAAVRRGLL